MKRQRETPARIAPLGFERTKEKQTLPCFQEWQARIVCLFFLFLLLPYYYTKKKSDKAEILFKIISVLESESSIFWKTTAELILFPSFEYSIVNSQADFDSFVMHSKFKTSSFFRLSVLLTEYPQLMLIANDFLIGPKTSQSLIPRTWTHLTCPRQWCDLTVRCR